ncbi:MAG TPA: SDR family NAD(P)-dependent oxidoreductase, partial [Bacillales bacterium]|nr:SDR family NAD(P)-dependent oxidoreductase [Bacillales bacterium]
MRENKNGHCDAEVRFDNQFVLVTGAGRGLGAAYARLIASRGGMVIVHDAGVERDGTGGDPGPATNVTESIKAAGGMAEAEFQDLSTREGCEDLVSSVLKRHGRIDAFVHSAGIVRYHGIAETSTEEWERMLN